MIDIGVSLGFGLFIGVSIAIALGAIGAKGIGAMLPRSWQGFDATDDIATGDRSGVSLIVDYGTGCEYLKAPGGGLTPRLDATGKQICRKAGAT